MYACNEVEVGAAVASLDDGEPLAELPGDHLPPEVVGERGNPVLNEVRDRLLDGGDGRGSPLGPCM